jgi:periplasmic protein TonB
MFEQSLLLNDSMARKSSAFAASLSAQILFAGVLTLIPLTYQEVLPLVKQSIPLAGPILTPPPPPDMPAQQQQSPAFAHLRGPSRPFLAPTRIPTTSPRPFVESFDVAPPVLAMTGTGDSAGLPFGDTPISRHDITGPPAHATPATTVKPDGPPVRVTSTILSAQLIKKVIPIYPALGRQVRVSGTVHLEGIVSKDGTIRNLQVLSGHPLLVPAALEAVRQWVYRPTLLNGVPVEVIAPIDVVFTLN